MKIEYNKMLSDAPTDKGPSIICKDNAYWWVDKDWFWHGPCSTKESAKRRQQLYILCVIEGHGIVIDEKTWKENIDREPLDYIHSCDDYAPWDCACAGACSCHFIERDF